MLPIFSIACTTCILPFFCSCIACIITCSWFFVFSTSPKIVSNCISIDSAEAVIRSILCFKACRMLVMFFPCALDSSASFLISPATTAKPFPASPAWAASIAAFIASRLVCAAIFWIILLVSKRISELASTSLLKPTDSVTAVLPLSVAWFNSSSIRTFVSMPPFTVWILFTIWSIEISELSTASVWISTCESSFSIVRIIACNDEPISITLFDCVITCFLTCSILVLIS